MDRLPDLATSERILSDANQRADAFFAPLADDQLADFADALTNGADLTHFVYNGTVDELLRAFSYATVIRELCRRVQIAALEDDAIG